LPYRPPAIYIYTLSLHDALPIYSLRTPGDQLRPSPPCRRRAETCRPARSAPGRDARPSAQAWRSSQLARPAAGPTLVAGPPAARSGEHTAELQSRVGLVCPPLRV